MTNKIILDSYINYDGILTTDERKKILNRIESAFSWLGATIPLEIELDGTKFKLRDEIKNLILKEELSVVESRKIERLITSLEDKEEFLTDIVKKQDISDIKALELSNQICGLLRAVHDLRELMKTKPKTVVLSAKEELMKDIEDKKRWLKYVKKLK